MIRKKSLKKALVIITTKVVIITPGSTNEKVTGEFDFETEIEAK